jgi:hypothetical protein
MASSRSRRRHVVIERDSSGGALHVAVGALAGLAAGVLLAQRYGGLSGLGDRVRAGLGQGWSDRLADRLGERFGDGFGDRLATRLGARRGPGDADADDPAGLRRRGYDTPDWDEEPLDDDAEADEGEMLEERVLEAFRNDPVLSERAIDIGAIGRGIIELTGWVHADDESTHAVTLTRGVPGVETVVNRLVVKDDEARLEDQARRYATGEAETSPRWEGMGVGTGRPRQGTSQDAGRHADPKPVLEDRWQDEGKAIRAAADDLEGIAERRKKSAEELPADRTGGAPIAPSGVPKGDHVADPAAAEPVLREQTGRVTRTD